MSTEQFGVRYEYDGRIFRVPSLDAARTIVGSQGDVLHKQGRSWVEVDPGTGPATHRPLIGRASRGMTSIRPSRPVYRTELRCTCGGFTTSCNFAPSNGGKRDVEIDFAEHLTEVAASLQESVVRTERAS